jgi:hypothetical protein
MGLKDSLRKMAADRNGPTQLVAVLNDPTKVVAIPVAYRKDIFAQYGISEDDLVGEAPFHMVFVREGLAFCILSQEGERARVTIHGVDLRPGEDANIELVGSEIYDMWKAIPMSQLMAYDQLTKNYAVVHKKVERPS